MLREVDPALQIEHAFFQDADTLLHCVRIGFDDGKRVWLLWANT
jgi:hypothetical protein